MTVRSKLRTRPKCTMLASSRSTTNRKRLMIQQLPLAKSTVAAATDEAAELENQQDGDDKLVEIGDYIAKETIEDVTLAPGLNAALCTEFMDLTQQYSALFTEAPGTTNLIEHHINLTTKQTY